MRKINWSDISKFTPGNFPEDPDKFAEPELIYRLNAFRIKLASYIFPSPVKGALARFDGGTSRHTVKEGRKSIAVDVFCTGVPFQIYSLALSLHLFNGIGIYLNTTGPDGRDWVMFHFDIRKKGFDYGIPLIWIVEKIIIKGKPVDKYRYPQYEPKYWKLLQNEKIYQLKQFGSSPTIS